MVIFLIHKMYPRLILGNKKNRVKVEVSRYYST
uniref:Translation initiation factor 1 n=1 Tax=Gentiana bavarica TaxID=49937 RepID=A0A8F4XHT7_9GENT|nr:translation initiation factor 1 [Gentiana bavarica]